MCYIPDDFKWSFSKLETYRNCPMQFKLEYIDNIDEVENAYALYGSFCHSLFEAWAKDEVPSFALADEYVNGYDKSVTYPFPPFPAGLGEKAYEAGLAYFEIFDGFGNDWEVVSAEERFEVDIEGYTFVGLADLILRNKVNGDIWIIDHKSKSSTSMRKDLPIFRHQLYIYAIAYHAKTGIWPKKLSFNLFKENKWVDEDFSMDAMDATKRWIVDTIKQIKADREWLVSPSSYFCKFICGVCNSCPAYDAVLAGDYDKRSKKEKS